MVARLGDIQPWEANDVGAELEWPDDVVSQLLFEHGARYYHAEQFGQLDLSDIEWSLEQRPAAELVTATHHPDKTKPETVAKDPHKELEARRVEGFEFWPDETWARPPLFIEGHLVEPQQPGLHLVEGHTRLGVLKGLVESGEARPDSLHLSWIARSKPKETEPTTPPAVAPS